MKVAVYYKNDDVRLEEMPKPAIQAAEFLVKMHASGICGSDVMEWYRIKKAPRVLGHEMTGEIVESKSKKYKVGQRVFVSHHVPCNECEYCTHDHHTACHTLHTTNYDPGGFAEYIRIPQINIDKEGVYVLPDNVSYEEGTFIEPLACIVRGQRLAHIAAGQRVLVIGSGISGLLHIQLAKLKGATVTAVDVNQKKLEYAKKFGADEVYPANEFKGKADCVIVCAGALSAAKQALQSVDNGGKILFFAVPEPGINLEVPINDFWRNEITMLTSYGAAPKDLDESLQLIKEKKLDLKNMVTHKFKLEECQKAFNTMVKGEGIKILFVS